MLANLTGLAVGAPTIDVGLLTIEDPVTTGVPDLGDIVEMDILPSHVPLCVSGIGAPTETDTPDHP